MDEATPYGEVLSGLSHTNHFNIIDREGNAIALTSSQGWPFGSGVIAPGTGFLLSNEIADWIDRPHGEAIGAFLDQPQAGARPISNQTPTIVVRDDLPVLVTGGAGGGLVPMGHPARDRQHDSLPTGSQRRLRRPSQTCH